MTLIRMKGLALWRAIAQALEAEIADGQLPPGGKLPTEHELAARFAVNRHTVRRALTALEEDGLVRVEQGSGWFVRERVIDYSLARRTYFSEILSRQSRIPGHQVTDWGETPAHGPAAQALDLPEGEILIWMETLGHADGRRISLSTRFFPKARFPRIVETYRETASVSACMAMTKVVDYHRRRTVLTARMPTPREAGLLGCARHRPLLVSESVNADGPGRPVEYGVTLFVSDWVRIVVNTGDFTA
ncbi:phosphonate metabolism transcriptional regulator PhnF [Fundidesulfovibrio butyratiphilus]